MEWIKQLGEGFWQVLKDPSVAPFAICAVVAIGFLATLGYIAKHGKEITQNHLHFLYTTVGICTLGIFVSVYKSGSEDRIITNNYKAKAENLQEQMNSEIVKLGACQNELLEYQNTINNSLGYVQNVSGIKEWERFSGILKFYNAPFGFLNSSHLKVKGEHLKNRGTFEILMFKDTTQTQDLCFNNRAQGLKSGINNLVRTQEVSLDLIKTNINIRIVQINGNYSKKNVYFIGSDRMNADQNLAYMYLYMSERNIIGELDISDSCMPKITGGIMFNSNMGTMNGVTLPDLQNHFTSLWNKPGNLKYTGKEFAEKH